MVEECRRELEWHRSHFGEHNVLTISWDLRKPKCRLHQRMLNHGARFTWNDLMLQAIWLWQ
jgi:hypothetical protein